MSIQFACPSCARGYSVKDELAGKSAKCGQCGHKMTIPAVGAKLAAAAKVPAPKAVAPTAKSPSVKSGASAAAKPVAAKPVAAKVSAVPAAKAKPVKTSTSDPGTSSWLDEELESSRAQAKAKPAAPTPMSSDAPCPSCNAPMASGAVICVSCGYDKRIRGRRSLEHVEEGAAAPKCSKLGHMGSLLRGSIFSFLGAMLGAIIWAVLCYLTMHEFGIVAWGLGGLAGFGMALGHEDSDGTFAGIIAAFMSLLGIIAAKVFIVIIFIAAAVSTIVSEMPLDADGQGFDMAALQRTALVHTMALKDIEAGGQRIEDEDDPRWVAAVEKAEAEVATLTPEEIEKRLNELVDEGDVDGDIEEGDARFANEEDDLLAEEDAASADDTEFEDDGPTFGSLFGPIDGLWILLAFFTAYKVGSGQSED